MTVSREEAIRGVAWSPRDDLDDPQKWQRLPEVPADLKHRVAFDECPSASDDDDALGRCGCVRPVRRDRSLALLGHPRNESHFSGASEALYDPDECRTDATGRVVDNNRRHDCAASTWRLMWARIAPIPRSRSGEINSESCISVKKLDGVSRISDAVAPERPARSTPA